MVKRFIYDQDGNATIDWVVLTAGLMMLGIALGVSISTPANDLAQNIDTTMRDMQVTTY